MSSRRAIAAVALLAAALAAGCGYRLAGTWAQLPAGIRSVHIPGVENQTSHQELDVPVTEAFRDRLESLGYPPVSQERADSLLMVRILSCGDNPISWDQTQSVREYRIIVSVGLDLVRPGEPEPIRSSKGIFASEPYAAGATQEETNGNRAEALAAVAIRLASDGIERLLTGF